MLLWLNNPQHLQSWGWMSERTYRRHGQATLGVVKHKIQSRERSHIPMEKRTHLPNRRYVSFSGHLGWHQTWWRCCTRTWGHRGCVAWPSGEKSNGILRYLGPMGLSRWWFQIFVDPISRWHNFSMRGSGRSLLNHPTIHILNSLGASRGCSIVYVLWLLWLGIFWAMPPCQLVLVGPLDQIPWGIRHC